MARRWSPRLTTVLAAQPGWAQRAAATAARTSSARERATSAITRPSAGARFSKRSPASVPTSLPSMKFGIRAGGRRSTMA